MFNIYRVPTACGGTLDFSRINDQPVDSRLYLDEEVIYGTYCYYVTAINIFGESGASNLAEAEVR